MISGLLLAAGESTRMGTLKALLEWEGSTLLEYQVSQLLAARLGEVVVVLGHEAERLRAVLEATDLARCPSFHLVYNPDYRSGKTSSIRTGVAALNPAATGVLILGVDQPRRRVLLDCLIEQHGDALLSVPLQGGRRGHPPIFGRALFPELLALSEEREGLREVLRTHAAETRLIPLDDSLVHLNLNRPEDYSAARR